MFLILTNNSTMKSYKSNFDNTCGQNAYIYFQLLKKNNISFFLK